MRGHSVCWMHGARGGAPDGNRNALKHGEFSGRATVIADRQLFQRRALFGVADRIIARGRR